MDDTIYRQAAIDTVQKYKCEHGYDYADCACDIEKDLKALPPAQPTLYGYSIENLALIAALLAKENLPPERVSEALSDIGRIIALVRKESGRSDEKGGGTVHDLISRQSAIDTHCELCADRGKCPDICPDVEVFRLIAPAQPLVPTCDGCRNVGTYDTDFPCSGCIRREKDYYEQER